jgi:hypothetical protein
MNRLFFYAYLFFSYFSCREDGDRKFLRNVAVLLRLVSLQAIVRILCSYYCENLESSAVVGLLLGISNSLLLNF